MEVGIYAITSPSGKMYIGSTISFKVRWKTHRTLLRRGTHHSRALQMAWNKYGEGSMIFSKLIVCSKADLLMYEQRAIDLLRPQYNIARFAHAPTLGMKHSKETIEKMSAWQKGRKLSDTHRRSMSIANKGKKISPTVREKIRSAMVGRQVSEATRKKLSSALSGRKFTEEHRKNMSLVRKGKAIPEAQRLAHAALMTGPGNPAARSIIASVSDLTLSFSMGVDAVAWLRENGHPKASAGRISDVCSGNRKTAYGFHWRYADAP